MIQRENLAGQNRPPRSRIEACSALVRLETLQSCLLPFEGPGGGKRLLFVNSLPTASFVSREIFFL